MAENDMGVALDWDDAVTDEGGFRLLDEGTYEFQVVALERERFQGSDKMAPCPRAKLTLSVMDADGSLVTITDRMNLSTKTQYILSRFFECLGWQKEADQDGKMVMPMHWNDVIGRTGRLRLVQKPGFKDPTKTFNEVAEYLRPDEAPQQGTLPIDVPAQPQGTRHPGWSM